MHTSKGLKRKSSELPAKQRTPSRLAIKKARVSPSKKEISSRSEDNDEFYWFKYFREELRKETPIRQPSLRQMNNTDVGLSNKERKFIEIKRGRHNHIISDEKNQIWFVKEHFKESHASVEWVINKALEDNNIRNVVTARYFFRGRPSAEETSDSFFLVFPFIKSVTLAKSERSCSDRELVEGLLTMLKTFRSFEPGRGKPFSMIHGDLKADQVLVERKPDGAIQWWLIDFGLADIEAPMKQHGVLVSSHITASKSAGSIQTDDINRLFSMFKAAIQNPTSRDRVDKIWNEGLSGLDIQQAKLESFLESLHE